MIEAYITVDEIPEVAAARREIRAEAWEIVGERERLLATDQEAVVPLEVDALSTAQLVNAAQRQYGPESPQYHQLRAGLTLDCQRLVAEWYRKKRPEYFPASRHFFDAATGEFYSHGLSVSQMTQNALRPIEDNPEEVARRVNERVENETPRILQKVGGFALHGAGIRTISECTDKAIRDYEADVAQGGPHRGYNGYVPEIQKVMIRDMRVDEATGDRLEEQIGLPGVRINHFVIQEALRRRGVEAGGLDKTRLHGQQLIVQDDLIEFVALLDEVASEEWRVPVFLGEDVDEDFQKDYSNVRAEALGRQSQLQQTAETVAVFLLDIAEEEQIDPRSVPAKVEAFVKMLLLDMAKTDVTVAEQIFDPRTAIGLQRVVQLEAAGRQAEAQALLRDVEKAAPGGGYCGAGSCGLERVDLNSKDGKELAKNLKAKAGDKILKDKERHCTKCGQRNVAYAYNDHKVNKYCGDCKSFESTVKM